MPFIVRFPGKIEGNCKTNTFGFVKDVFPTILEVTGAKNAGSNYKGRKAHQPDGTSIWPVMTGEAKNVHDESEVIGYELAGSNAVFRGTDKLSQNPPPKGSGQREFYDVSTDPSERNNLASVNPHVVQELKQAYVEYKQQVALVPVPDGYDPQMQVLKNSHQKH